MENKGKGLRHSAWKREFWCTKNNHLVMGKHKPLVCWVKGGPKNSVKGQFGYCLHQVILE